jgi:hypothetical protein
MAAPESTMHPAGELEAAAATIDLTPEPGVPCPVGPIEAIQGPLGGALLVVRSRGRSIAWVTLNLATLTAEYDAALAAAVARATGVADEAVVLGCSRNLSTPLSFGGANATDPGVPRLPYHDSVIAALERAAAGAVGRLQPACLRYAEGALPELQYNRKGRRSDGTTFFKREEDLRARPEDVGWIDARVPLLAVDTAAGEPIAVVTQYIGDPCIATRLDRGTVNPDLPGYAVERLALRLGRSDLPVLYFQGCKADVAIRHMFEGDACARASGARLGEELARLHREAEPIDAGTVAERHGRAVVPLEPLPAAEVLVRELEELDAFRRRIDGGENPDLLLGHNFPAIAPPRLRLRTAESMRAWTEWALAARRRGAPVAGEVWFDVHAYRIGGFVLATTAPELFGHAGLEIRERAPGGRLIVACCSRQPWPSMPGAGRWAYLPGSADLDGNEYMTCHYRYTRFLTQFAPPAGDAVRDALSTLVNAVAAA